MVGSVFVGSMEGLTVGNEVVGVSVGHSHSGRGETEGDTGVGVSVGEEEIGNNEGYAVVGPAVGGKVPSITMLSKGEKTLLLS